MIPSYVAILSWRRGLQKKKLLLTCVGEVTLMFGVAASPNRLIMLSCFRSLDGVALGGGGTAGFNWKRT